MEEAHHHLRSTAKVVIGGMLAALLSLAFVELAFGSRCTALEAVILILLAGPMSLLYTKLRNRPRALVIFAALLCLALRLLTPLRTAEIGDTGEVEKLLVSGAPFTRWLLGLAVLQTLYGWISPWVSAELFVTVGGMVLFWGFLLYAAHRWRSSPVLALLLSAPIIFLQGSGYSEYYPFITGFLVILLCAISEGALERLSPILLGVLFAALGLIYIGYIPVVGVVALYVLMRLGDRRSRMLFIGSMLFSGFLLVFLAWGSPFTLPGTMYADVNTTAEWTVRRYREGVIEGVGILSPGFALQPKMLADRFFMLFFGAGPGLILLTSFSVVAFIQARPCASTNAKKVMAVIALLVLVETLFFLLMPPHLGRRRDIDLFAQAYIIYLFAAATGGEKLLPKLYPFIVGANVPITWILLRGIPTVGDGGNRLGRAISPRIAREPQAPFV